MPAVDIKGKPSTSIDIGVVGLSQYKISDMDDSGVVYAYYGFLDKDGNWYIMQEDTVLNQYRYIKGAVNYINNWANRAILVYDYSNNVW